MVVAAETDDEIAPGGSAADAHGGKHGLGAGVAEGDARQAGHLGKELCAFARERGLRADLPALVELLAHGIGHEFWLVAPEDRAKAIGGVDVLVAVEIPEIGAVGAVGDDGVDQLLHQRPEARDGAGIGQMAAIGLGEGLGLAGFGEVARAQFGE